MLKPSVFCSEINSLFAQGVNFCDWVEEQHEYESISFIADTKSELGLIFYIFYTYDFM